mgnify:CR=1 FL=1
MLHDLGQDVVVDEIIVADCLSDQLRRLVTLFAGTYSVRLRGALEQSCLTLTLRQHGHALLVLPHQLVYSLQPTQVHSICQTVPRLRQ